MNIPGSTRSGKPEGEVLVNPGPSPEGSPWLPWVVLALAVSASFALGLIAGREAAKEDATQDRFWIEQLPPEALIESGAATPAPKTEAAAGNVVPATGVYVASKSGSKYYLPSCSGAGRIKKENQVWFLSKEDAVAAGYEPAANCAGL